MLLNISVITIWVFDYHIIKSTEILNNSKIIFVVLNIASDYTCFKCVTMNYHKYIIIA